MNFGNLLATQLDNPKFTYDSVKPYKLESNISHITKDVFVKFLLPLARDTQVNKGAFTQGAFNEFIEKFQNNNYPEITSALEQIVESLTNFTVSLKTPLKNISTKIAQLTNTIIEKVEHDKSTVPLIFADVSSNELDPKIFETYTYLDWDKDFNKLFQYTNSTNCSISNISSIYNELISKYQVNIKSQLTPLRNFEILILDHINDYNKIRFNLKRNQVLCETLYTYIKESLGHQDYTKGFINFIQNKSCLEDLFNHYFALRKNDKSTILLFNPRDVSYLNKVLAIINSTEFQDEQRYLTLLFNYDKSLISAESAQLINNFLRIHVINTLTLTLGLALIKQAANKDTLIIDDTLINKEVKDKYPKITSKDIANQLYFIKKNKQQIPYIGIGASTLIKTKDQISNEIINDQKNLIKNQTYMLEDFTRSRCHEVIVEHYTELYKTNEEELYHFNEVYASFKYDADLSIEDNLYSLILQTEYNNNPTIQLFFKLFKEQTEQMILSQEQNAQIDINNKRNDILFNTYKLLLGNILKLNIQKN
jgi:hypothetical protein